MSEKHAEADDAIVATFHEYVNMPPRAIDAWLKTDQSKDVGQKASGSAESTGHESGRNIVKLLHKKRDIEQTRWASSLKNWGHDPGKN